MDRKTLKALAIVVLCVFVPIATLTIAILYEAWSKQDGVAVGGSRQASDQHSPSVGPTEEQRESDPGARANKAYNEQQFDDERDWRDLAAQESMARAADLMLWITGATLAATVAAVFFAGWAARATDRTARITREIGVAQTRAYIGVPEVTAVVRDIDGIGQTISVIVTLGNTGQSPAINTRFEVTLSCPSVFPTLFIMGRRLVYGRDITAGERGVEMLRKENFPIPKGMKGNYPGDHPIFRVNGEIEYDTVFETVPATIFEFSVDLVYPPNEVTGRLRVRPSAGLTHPDPKNN
ncbi:hypothetical protein RDV64_21075 [Acuticoccus sp. MNP-M23]|uniref:hypothetical protein n=1 Tax=Acuticoccus sp. MNP-M23 TaxID=3072793 RepID=UPI002815DC81|nr:hypothetical protein [Acuticoccus sp. MNP-M23]WMS42526.1 hypothetical protein RDV64_21075 [Acuticoccus sp. MNP-M23]